MDNTPEGENKQFHHTWPTHHEPIQPLSHSPEPAPGAPRPAEISPLPPAPVPPAPAPAPVVTPLNPTPSTTSPFNPAPAGSPHFTTTLILQWLTYAFWGWSLLALSFLTASVFQRLIVGTDPSTFNYYVIAALVVLLPISFFCDKFYSKQEPDKKVGPASLIMIVHAVIFALFTIAGLLFAAWSVVGIATNSIDRSTQVAYLISSLFISVFYAATFMRTLNPAHIRWIPRIYGLAFIGVAIIFVILGFTKPSFHSTASTAVSSTGEQLNTKGTRRPAQYLHICTTGSNITYVSQGSPKCLDNDSYQSDYDPSVPGLLYSSPCQTTSGAKRYVYIAESETCPSGTKLVFYNNVCPTDAESSDECTGGDQSDSDPSTSTSSNNFDSSGKLEPSVVGGTQCDIPTLDDQSTTGQVDLSGGATCDEAEANIQSATGKKGGGYTANGYTCTSTKQGANTQWSDYWDNNFYSYKCTSGSKQTAFNLQTVDQSQSSPTLTD